MNRCLILLKTCILLTSVFTQTVNETDSSVSFKRSLKIGENEIFKVEISLGNHKNDNFFMRQWREMTDSYRWEPRVERGQMLAHACYQQHATAGYSHICRQALQEQTCAHSARAFGELCCAFRFQNGGDRCNVGRNRRCES
ncbi:hypothetical protein TcasGA2_TC031540 [Tribolium castaneum]|uniref:Secreted protein n=1 Tax=Tribolium castaneum TaxID=7070 RepID=A0A139WP42_TRICA|nr:hypothetical protein TcasGA2_TC031540 [Tribolium castaneum]